MLDKGHGVASATPCRRIAASTVHNAPDNAVASCRDCCCTLVSNEPGSEAPWEKLIGQWLQKRFCLQD